MFAACEELKSSVLRSMKSRSLRCRRLGKSWSPVLAFYKVFESLVLAACEALQSPVSAAYEELESPVLASRGYQVT